ncbi:hypothetical protein KBY96_12775 [Cyanobium sp. ATX 6A2]|jgi:hypothetical protein|uniref:hypothetical protein n=1 Tax=Cyanobium sp. ATX 6A2 TaxID=2823700 RepID=UPI0020CCD9ED|nr:hypothetical protein [Cyanobium sp. ATX 6A2]MCP9888798.1 hypothetical protein [Cyanobium sp. ATX 6A2]
MAEPALSGPTSQLLAALTPEQQRRLQGWSEALDAAPNWHGTLPVVLLERCWLRLQAVTVATLADAVPADTSAEAPELMRWRQLTEEGSDPWSAQLVCWQEFGAQACQQAQHRHWQQQERHCCGWTFADYLGLLRDYRRGLVGGASRRLPLLVLRRPDGEQRHALHWLPSRHQPMRHTCP